MTLPLSGRQGRVAFRQLAAARRPVFFFDVDGTLAPLVTRPETASAPHRTRRLLLALQATGARVVLVTGRAARDAYRVVGFEFDGILGNHGAELLRKNRLARWTGGDVAAIHAVARRIARKLEHAWPDVRVEEKGHSIALHHRLNADRFPQLLTTVRQLLRGGDIVALAGRQVVDIRARGADKGTSVLRWLERIEKGGIPLAEVFYAGDDTTDEDAFRELGTEAVTVAVGRRPKGARFRTPGPLSLAKWLHHMERVRR